MNDSVSGGHVGENAELYALGLLEDGERAALDAHVVSCDACLRRVGEAEETAAALAQGLPRQALPGGLAERISRSARMPLQTQRVTPIAPRLRRRVHPAWLAATAAVAASVAIALSGYQTFLERSSTRHDEVALATVARSHFFHQSFIDAVPYEQLTAKVLYARDGSWLYVILDRPPPEVHVAATVGGVSRDLGAPLAEGRVATLFVPDAGHPARLEIRTGSKLVASARLTYAP